MTDEPVDDALNALAAALEAVGLVPRLDDAPVERELVGHRESVRVPQVRGGAGGARAPHPRRRWHGCPTPEAPVTQRPGRYKTSARQRAVLRGCIRPI